jgi:parallel beta-helix repeat protein
LLRNNTIAGYKYNFGVSYGYYFQDIDASNTVDGKPIYYWINRQNDEIPSDAGYVAIVNSTNIRVEGLELKNNYQGVLIANSNDLTIRHNNVTNNRYGIRFEFSLNNTISENDVTDNSYDGISFVSSRDNDVYRNRIMGPYGTGISLDSSSNNTFSQNEITNNTDGIFLSSSLDNTVSGNNISLNYDGIWLVASSNNTIYHNNFINNTNQVGFWAESLLNVWDNGYPSGGNCWSDYTGIDAYSGPYQNITGSDGIGDMPYVIDENNTDRYPLGVFGVHLLGDLNQDGIVNVLDAIQAASAFGSHAGDPKWNEQADINRDGVVNILDVIVLANNFGKHSWETLLLISAR